MSIQEDFCPCGTIWLPIGGKYSQDGLFIRIEHQDGHMDLPLTHNTDIFLSAGQQFTSSTSKIEINSDIVINNISLYSKQYQFSLLNQINAIFRIGHTPISNSIVGSFGETTVSNTVDNKHILLTSFIDSESRKSINLNNSRIILDLYSLCEAVDQSCCDKLPSSLILSNYNLVLDCPTTTTTSTTTTITTIPPTTTTSTTTLPPIGSCCEVGVYWDDESQDWIQYRNCLGVMTESECDPRQGFEGARIWQIGQTCEDNCQISDPCNINLPDTFLYTVVGYGLISGQEKQVIVNKVGNSWIAQGTFPCGINFYISMTCDPQTGKFVYDGFADCGAGTKTVVEPSDIPYIYPNGRSPLIIAYSDLSGCPEECKECCKWNGSGFIQFPQVCFDNRRLELNFIQINEHIWEVSQVTACGDSIEAIISCDPDIVATDAASCLQKWKVLHFNINCATNARIINQVLELCDCQKPPVVTWIADDFSACQCCCEDFNAIMPGTTAHILPVGVNINAGDILSIDSTGTIILAADGRSTNAPQKLEIYIGDTLISVHQNLNNFITSISGPLGVRYRDEPHNDNSGQYDLSIKVCPAL